MVPLESNLRNVEDGLILLIERLWIPCAIGAGLFLETEIWVYWRCSAAAVKPVALG